MTIVSDVKRPARLIVFKCDNCSIEFERGSQTKPKLDYRLLSKPEHYCTYSCAYSSRKINHFIEITCNECSLVFKKPRANLKETNFCSRDCYWLYRKTDPRCRVSKGPLTDATKQKISKANKGKQARLGAVLSNHTKAKISKGNKGKLIGDKNPMWGKKHTSEIKDKISEVVSRNIVSGKHKGYGKNNHLSGRFSSIKTNEVMFYRSSWELATMKWLDSNENVVTYQYESIRIPYYFLEGNTKTKRHYIPDFLIEFTSGEKELWELKPEKLSDNKKTKAKIIAANDYCKPLGITFKLLHKTHLLDMKILH